MLYDYESSAEVFTTHVKSFFHHEGFEITYLIDKDEKKLSLAKAKYDNGRIKFVTDIDDIDILPEIFVLSSLPTINYAIFDKLKDCSEIKYFIVEKPFYNSDKFNGFNLSQYSDRCIVNYIRKFLPFFKQLKQNITDNTFGMSLGIHVWYSKGLRNNGSHILDLIHFLFNGSFVEDTINVFQTVQDNTNTDSSLGFSGRFRINTEESTFPIVFQVAHEHCFSLTEMDIIFEKSRFRIFEFGDKCEIYEVIADPLFPNYQNLVSNQIESLNLNKYGLELCNYIHKLLSEKETLISTLNHDKALSDLIDTIKSKK